MRSLVLLLICSALAVCLAGCRDKRVGYINKVKNSTMPRHGDTTIGKAFEATFDNPKWESFETKKGRRVVQFTGTISEELSSQLSGNLSKYTLEKLGIDYSVWNTGNPVTFQWIISPNGVIELSYVDKTSWVPKKSHASSYGVSWILTYVYTEHGLPEVHWQVKIAESEAKYMQGKTWVKCRACGVSWKMDLEEYHKFIQENADAFGTTPATTMKRIRIERTAPRSNLPPPIPCPKCGEPSGYRVVKCEKCGEIFERGTVPADFADRCPKCGHSHIEQERLAVRN